MRARIWISGLVGALMLMSGCGLSATGHGGAHVTSVGSPSSSAATSTSTSSASGTSSSVSTSAEVQTGASASTPAATAETANMEWAQLNALIQEIH